MRLVHYINEYKEKTYSLDRIKAVELIEKNCSKYLKETKGKWFLREIKYAAGLSDNELGYRQIRKNRKPKGMNLKVYNWFNKWLQSNGHIRRDQSIPMTSDRKHILITYPLICFVEGNYDYTWAATADINQNYLKSTTWYNDIVQDMYNINVGNNDMLIGPSEFQQIWITIDDIKENKKKIKDWVSKNFPKFFFTNRGMQRAYENKYEIWFKAKGYYYIKPFGNIYNHLSRKWK